MVVARWCSDFTSQLAAWKHSVMYSFSFLPRAWRLTVA